jgi:hypothetical protein
MPMPIDQWDRLVSYHLIAIEAGADMVTSHVDQLPLRPDFLTKAEFSMQRAEAALALALNRVREAQATYRGKETEA